MTERLLDFVTAMTRLADAPPPDEAGMLQHAGGLLRTLVAQDDWLPDAMAVPHPQFYQQHLLYGDPLDRFSLVSFVWGPGQKTPVHDHTVWGIIGMLRGAECGQRFAIRRQKSICSACAIVAQSTDVKICLVVML